MFVVLLFVALLRLYWPRHKNSGLRWWRTHSPSTRTREEETKGWKKREDGKVKLQKNKKQCHVLFLENNTLIRNKYESGKMSWCLLCHGPSACDITKVKRFFELASSFNTEWMCFINLLGFHDCIEWGNHRSNRKTSWIIAKKEKNFITGVFRVQQPLATKTWSTWCSSFLSISYWGFKDV